MIIWGISANSHNAALAVFDDTVLIFASETERFSGKKNDKDLNQSIIDAAVEYSGYPDKICWYENPYLKTARQLYAGQGWLWQENRIKNYLNKHQLYSKINYSNHHHSHAAAGYYTSKFDHACVLVIDAIGEFECLTVWKAKGTLLKKVYSYYYPNSAGLFYSAMTDRCGLKANEEEYILMGMSAFGDPSRFYNEILEDFVDITQDHPFSVKHNLHRGCRYWRRYLTSEQDTFDIAAGTQAVYETMFERALRSAKKLVPSNNLVLMGGCALNCVANVKAYKYFDNVWIMPAPGDNGSAIGAVLADLKSHITWPGPYLGHDMGYVVDDRIIVDHLEKFKICGLARGRAEFGPRALGNRSLIADPRGQDIKHRVNQIKIREKFRPFAPAILSELAYQYFDIPMGRSSDYMQMVYRCLRPDLFPAVVHIDGTSRIQTVPERSGRFRTLLELWYHRTGCPMLLNTSLNIKGQPIINTDIDSQKWSSLYGLPIFT